MLLSYSKIIGLPVIGMRSQLKVGQVVDAIIEPNNLAIIALAGSNGSFFSTKKFYILQNDVLSLVKNGLVIHDDELLVENLADLPKLKELLKQKYFGLYQKVVTENGKSLGRVYDYIFDSTSFIISKFYVRGFFSDRIIPAKQIIKFENRIITIKDDKAKVEVETPQPAPAAE